MMKRTMPILLLACFAGTAFAQQTAASGPPQGFGQVSGRVFCNDTGLPARFASVQLLAEHPATTPLFNPATIGKHPDFAKLMASAMETMMKGSHLGSVTALDGTFSLNQVPPGTYYVIAQLPGYVSPVSGISQMARMKADSATVSAVESVAQKVEVQAGQSTFVNVSLKRGGVITGTVQYDDGSPAPGVTLGLVTRGKDGKWAQLSTSMVPVSTDDRGQFRFYGLSAGDYAVKATLPVTQAMVGLGPSSLAMHMDLGDALVVYSGGAMRDKDIQPIELSDGQEVDGVTVTFPIHGLFTVGGTVEAKSDGHAVSLGTVELEYSDSKETIRSAMIQADGTFQMNYVPQGSYVLKVTSAGDSAPGGDAGEGPLAALLSGKKPVKEYGTAELPVNLSSDATGLVVQVPDKTTGTPPTGAGTE